MKKDLISFALAVLALASCSKNELGKAGDTVKKIQTDFYSMTVDGDAGFKHFLEQGGASSTEELADFLGDYLSAGPWGKLKCTLTPGEFACSALCVQSPDGAPMMGRNFDWDDCKSMIVSCFPKNAYASVSTVNLDFLGFGEDYKPEGMINCYKATAGVYVPMDGINQMGLVVADLMAGDKEITAQSEPGKKNLTTTTAIRLLLNYAADVDEAVKLLSEYNVHSDIGSAHHLMIADAKGRSVAVEWVDNQMIVTPSEVLNNHYLCDPKKGVGSGEESLAHEKCLLELNAECGGVMDSEQLADAMFKVLSLPNESYYGGTQWTIVYNLRDCSATYYLRRDRDRAHSFSAGR